MSPGKADGATVQRHLLALDRAVQQLRKHAGQPLEALDDLDEVWAVERGLQLCVQNCLDVATHLALSAGPDVADYASARRLTIPVRRSGSRRCLVSASPWPTSFQIELITLA